MAPKMKASLFTSSCRAAVQALGGRRRYCGAKWMSSTVSGEAQHRSPDLSTSTPGTNPQRKRNNWSYTAEVSALAVRLGHKVENVPSLLKALQQDSHVRTIAGHGAASKQVVINPNRFSVLGRSTMLHYVNEYLYYSYPLMDGTMLLDLANSLTNQFTLVKLANHFGVTDLIKTKLNLSFPENGIVISQSLCGVFGAIYQDQGPKPTKKLVHEMILPQLAGQDMEEVVKLEHPRLMLNTILSKQKRPKPVARLISESGRATHFPSFVVGVFSGESCLGEGTGTSLRRAEHEAMLTALRTHLQKELLATALPSDQEEFFTEEELKDRVITE